MVGVLFSNDTPPAEIYTLSLHDALPISGVGYSRDLRVQQVIGVEARCEGTPSPLRLDPEAMRARSEEHTSELQSLRHLVCRLLLEKKKKNKITTTQHQTTQDKQHGRAKS